MEQMQAVFFSLNRIFYDGLSKGALIKAIHVVLRTLVMVNWMLQQYAGITAPRRDQKAPFSV